MIHDVMLPHFNLTKRFGRTVANDDPSSSADPRENLDFLDLTGAGKTTTISMIAGLLRHDDEHIEIDGAGASDRPKVRRKIGVAQQAPADYDALSAVKNLVFFGKLTGLTGTSLRKRVEWALDFVVLADRRRDRARTNSGGMRVVTAHKSDEGNRNESNDPIQEYVRLQREGGILSLRVDRPSLETVFLNLSERALRD